MNDLRLIPSLCSAGAMVLCAGIVCGQSYPVKPIRLVDGAAGGGTDFTARLVAQGISGPLGQPIIVDNRPPGIGQGEIVVKAPPDGYTLYITGPVFWTTPLLRKTPYDVLVDFAPISQIERSVNIVAVNAGLPVKSIRELVALAKAKPGSLYYASAGVGGNAHLSGELFKSMAGVNIVHIPYKGNGPATTALIANEVQVAILDVGLVAPHIKSGKLRALAVSSAQPSPLAPGLPTVATSGLPGYEATGTTGMFAPAKTPADVLNRLSQEIAKFVNRSDVKEKFFDTGVETVGSSPQEFATLIRTQMTTWGKVIADAGIKAD